MRLIDADELRNDWLQNGQNEYVYDTNAFLESIDNAPTVDAEPVVWCEDCQHSNFNGHCMEVGKKYCTIHKRQFHYDFFCSYGERKG
jgi:hypothetical protein